MSECITHTAIVDDCSRLTRARSGICDAFKGAFGEHLDIAQLGGITRHGDRHNPSLLESWREKPAEEVRPKLAFVLGWLSHRAADRQMKRVFRAIDADCEEKPTECSIYNDACVYREVYGNAADSLYRFGGVESPSTVPADTVENLLAATWVRMLIRMHTFIPDDADAEGWIEKVVRFRQRLYVDLKRYAKAIADPDPDLWNRFIIEANFYQPEDPIIKAARSVQRGGGERVDEAVFVEPGTSHYAVMLRRACRYVEAASRFYVRKIDRAELETALNIGRPELEEVD